MAKNENPKNWADQFEIVRESHRLVSIWMPPANHHDGLLVAIIHADLIPSLASALLKFEQSEGR